VKGTHFYATAGDKIEQYEVASGKRVGVFDGHVNVVSGFLLSPDSSRLLSGSADGTVRLWDTKTQKELHDKEWHTPWVRAVLRSDGDHYVISTGIREIPGPTNSPTRTSIGGGGGGIIVIPR
jgi:WD40 repeat protein